MLPPLPPILAAPRPSDVASGQHVALLDGGTEAFPRMLAAIDAAQSQVHLEVYAFSQQGVGARFVEALGAAARRGVKVKVIVDGWGSLADARGLSRALRGAGARVRVYNPVTSFFFGRAWRNHRKILLVDQRVAYLGGINIGDAYADTRTQRGWADLALELRGPICVALSERLHVGSTMLKEGRVQIFLSGLGGGRKLRARYLRALEQARAQVILAHAYFLPDRAFIRALKRAARRGVEVRLLLPGRSDVPFARAASMRLYRSLLSAGVHIREWSRSTLHAKAAVVDGQCLLVGSFNLDPLSLVNLETLVEVDDAGVCTQALRWLARHEQEARVIGLVDCGRTPLQRWLLDIVGLAMARLAERTARFLGARGKR